jgi:hypothetical protein
LHANDAANDRAGGSPYSILMCAARPFPSRKAGKARGLLASNEEPSIMKYALPAILLALAATATTPPAYAVCSSCNIQTKAPSVTQPGKFDYRVSCIIDESGDEVNTVVTAATDEEAIEMAKKKGC